jgi:hypothetical protein
MNSIFSLNRSANGTFNHNFSATQAKSLRAWLAPLCDGLAKRKTQEDLVGFGSIKKRHAVVQSDPSV